MRIGNVARWKISGDVGVIVDIKGSYAKIRYNLVDSDLIKRKISDWIHQDELEVQKTD